jgi:hypothetical protein
MGMIKSARYLTVTANKWVAIRLQKNKVTFIGVLHCQCFLTPQPRLAEAAGR